MKQIAAYPISSLDHEIQPIWSRNASVECFICCYLSKRGWRQEKPQQNPLKPVRVQSVHNVATIGSSRQSCSSE